MRQTSAMLTRPPSASFQRPLPLEHKLRSLLHRICRFPGHASTVGVASDIECQGCPWATKRKCPGCVEADLSTIYVIRTPVSDLPGLYPPLAIPKIPAKIELRERWSAGT